MKYVGSKARISRHILPIIQGAIDRNGIETYVEPFVGGGNLIDKVHCHNRIGYDNNEYLIGFWQALQTGWNPGAVPMSKELYTQIKDYKELFRPEVVALAGFCATYNAKWFGGYAGTVKTKTGEIRNYYDEAVRNVLKQIPALADVVFQAKSYDEINLSGCLVYCDPPYEGTTKYIGSFNHSRYWEWVRKMSENNIVICSEYAAPDDFICIWEMERTTTLDKASRTKAIERLFVRRDSGGGGICNLHNTVKAPLRP